MAWLDFGMSKREIRAIILLTVISLMAVSFSVLFPASEPWALAVLGIAVLAMVLMLVVLWRAVLRVRVNYWRGRQPPAQGKS
jgi:hypothetical protein